MSKQILDLACETLIVNRYSYENQANRVAELERENAELRRENRVWLWRVDSIIRLIDGRELEECPE